MSKLRGEKLRGEWEDGRGYIGSNWLVCVEDLSSSLLVVLDGWGLVVVVACGDACGKGFDGRLIGSASNQNGTTAAWSSLSDPGLLHQPTD